MFNFIKTVFIITKKDIALEFRTKEIMSSMLVFSMIVVVVFSFIFDPGEFDLQKIVGGVYWMALVFSALLGLGKSMQSEIMGANLEAILLSPAGRNAVFYGKVLSNMLFMLFVQAIMIPMFTVLYEINIASNPFMLVVILLATYGFVLLGTLFSLIAAKSRTREILLPILLLPVSVPILLAAIQCTNAILANQPLDEYMHWVRLIIVYDIVFTTIATVVFETVVED